MLELLENFLSPWVVLYILTIVAIPIVTPIITRILAARRCRKRKQAGLNETVISNPGDQLKTHRRDSIIETVVAFCLILLVPTVLTLIVSSGVELPLTEDSDAEMKKINIAFVSLLIWALISGTTIAGNFLGGLAFRSLSAFSNAIQIGDRVTVCGHHGVVREIGIFYTKLATPDDDLVSIPSASLLGQVLSSTNAGSRASLCRIEFRLCPTNPYPKLQKAEDIIWATIQSSIYFDPAHPLKIYLNQDEWALLLIAKCYVSSTYEEGEFRSGITKQVLEGFDRNEIKLALRR